MDDAFKAWWTTDGPMSKLLDKRVAADLGMSKEEQSKLAARVREDIMAVATAQGDHSEQALKNTASILDKMFSRIGSKSW